MERKGERRSEEKRRERGWMQPRGHERRKKDGCASLCTRNERTSYNGVPEEAQRDATEEQV